MKLPRPLLVALLVLSLIVVPSKADLDDFFNGFGFHFRHGRQQQQQQEQQEQQAQGNDNQDPPGAQVNEPRGSYIAGAYGMGGSPPPPQAVIIPDPAVQPAEPADFKPAQMVITNNLGGLSVGFYDRSCPNAEKIVADWLAELIKTNPSAPANIIRLAFHDCAVGGCDASILLDSIGQGDKVEKGSIFNGMSLKGADLIDDLKMRLEEECPQTVSCADAIAFSANEAMAIAGGVRQRPLGGRRDALNSLATAADQNLASPTATIDQMSAIFRRLGFNQEEMVVLLGAHSVGTAHCDLFMDRVYNFRNTQKPDPVLPLPYVEDLRRLCANPGTPQFRNPNVNFDETPYALDNRYFKNLVQNKALLLSDSSLKDDPRTGPTVRQMAEDDTLFPKRFAELFTKMTTFNVLTGLLGEVRKTCRSTNN
ncbi:peroxidase C1C-like [Arachis duranensis]|uniref:peroxidase n=1 Tax=Arachis duranensis TaxID=130453 RepID=A0A6P4DI47_ARADU|nr:peroxidase C1C-like [Arachis duranensis]